MIPLTITTNVETHPWTDLREVFETQGELADLVRVGRLPRGTITGKSTVSIVVRMPDGTLVAAQTTLALFVAAARVLDAAEVQETGKSAQMEPPPGRN